MKAISLKYEPKESPAMEPTPYPGEGCPSLYMSFSDDRLEALPDEGEITFKYKIVSRTETERGGKESGSVEMMVKEIVNVKGAKKESKELDTMEALDTLKKALESES